MPIRLKTNNGEKITIETDPFDKGGEGNVHMVVSPAKYKGYCAKLYRTDKDRTKEKENKIQYMTYNKPAALSGGFYRICWPEETLYQSGKFMGFIMKLAFPSSILAYELTTQKISHRLSLRWDKKYPRVGGSLEPRLKLCTNMAIAIHVIHSTQEYTLVDLKPHNMLITVDGKVSIIDCDSFQIAKNKKVIFPAKFATPDYSPMERLRINPSKSFIPTSWDNFSLAVMFYQIMFGIHPYAATFSAPYDQTNETQAKISKGLFVHGKNKSLITASMPFHDNYKKIPNRLKNLFFHAFEKSNNMPDIRPSAEDWGKTLKNIINSSTKVEQFSGSTTTRRPNPPPKSPSSKPSTLSNNTPQFETTKTEWFFMIGFCLIVIGAIIYANN